MEYLKIYAAPFQIEDLDIHKVHLSCKFFTLLLQILANELLKHQYDLELLIVYIVLPLYLSFLHRFLKPWLHKANQSKCFYIYRHLNVLLVRFSSLVCILS